MKKLLIIDDIPLFIAGLTYYLEQHTDYEIHSVDDFYGGLLAKVSELEPDLVIVNVTTTGQLNIELIKSIVKLIPAVRILAISDFRLKEGTMNIFKSGCKGLLFKGEQAEVYLRAVQAVMEGDDFYTPDAVKIILDHFSKGNPDNLKIRQTHQFSVRELEIIRLICRQLTAKEIGNELFISEKTVDFHRQKLVERMGVRNMSGIILYAIKNKLVDVETIPLMEVSNEKSLSFNS